ncbi:M13 family metallopeptidase [Halobacteriovorax marinus]|nr:M13 family metallopeptidase [Halobacteriovorax marinus]
MINRKNFRTWSSITILSIFLIGCNKEVKNRIPDKRDFPINTSAPACNDFYDHVCSKVIDSFELPANRARYAFAFSDSDERILEFKKKFLSELRSRDAISKRESQLKNYYMSCLDLSLSEKSELNYIKETKEKINNIKSKEELISFINNQFFKGQQSLIGVEPFANPSNPSKSDLLVTANVVTLPDPSYYLKKDLTNDLKVLITEFFQIIGDKSPEQTMKTVWNFEESMSKVSPNKIEIRQLIAINNVKTIAEFKKAYPALQIDNVLTKLPKGLNIRDFMPKTMKHFNNYVDQSSLDDLKNIYLYLTLFGTIEVSHKEFSSKKYHFLSTYLGKPKERAPRGEECTEMIKQRFSKEIDFFVIDKMFPNFPEERIKKLVQSIRGSIVDSLEKNQWLSKQGKEEAIKKIQSALLQIVKPKNEEEWDFNYLGEYSEKDYIYNDILLGKLTREKRLEDATKPINREKWGMAPLAINAFYNPTLNKFVLLQGILQYPFFDSKMDDRDIIAGMGMVIGHELGHSIDDNGSRYDSEGRLRKWLKDEDKKKFDELTKPLIEQFNSVGHDGKMTLGENIGDLVGLAAAYKTAFPDSTKEYSKEDQQNFFKAYGRIWCEVQTDSMKELRLKSDYHSLGRQRVNQQVKNHPGFTEAFSCKEGDKMYLPESKRVKIW